MTINQLVKKLEHSSDLDAIIELIANCAAEGQLYDLLLNLDHDYIIESAGRTYMASDITVSDKHNVHILPNLLIVCREIGKPETFSRLPLELERAIGDAMEHMFWSCDDVEEDGV